jgi:hypothetical protein
MTDLEHVEIGPGQLAGVSQERLTTKGGYKGAQVRKNVVAAFCCRVFWFYIEHVCNTMSFPKQAQDKQKERIQHATPSLFELFLCLSRACLGKMIILMYKWLKKTVFLLPLCQMICAMGPWKNMGQASAPETVFSCLVFSFSSVSCD